MKQQDELNLSDPEKFKQNLNKAAEDPKLRERLLKELFENILL